MAIKYLDAKRIRGNYLTGASGWVTSDSTYLNVNTTTEKIDWALKADDTDDHITYNLGTALSNTLWVFRCTFRFTANHDSTAQFFAGMSSTGGAQNTAQDFIGACILTGDNQLRSVDSDGATIPISQDNLASYTWANNTDYFLEIKRTAEDAYSCTVRTVSHAGSTVATAAGTCTSTTVGLQYILFANRVDDNDDDVVLTIDDVSIDDGTSTYSSADYEFDFGLQDDKATLITTFSDSLGTAGNATSNTGDLVTSSPAPVLGTGCLDFDGSSEYCDATSGLQNAMDTAGSISFWFNQDAEAEGIIIGFCATGSNTKFEMTTRVNRKLGIQCKVSGVQKWEVTSDTLYSTYGNWSHVVITHTGTSGLAEIYINGSLATMTRGSINDNTVWWTGLRSAGCNGLELGVKPALNGNSRREWYNGKLDDFGMWNRALTSTEVAKLYNNNGSGTGGTDAQKCSTIPSGLTVYYSCDSATVTNELADYSDLPENTLFEETDTRKLYWLQSNEWRDINYLGTPTWSSDFTSTSGWTSSDSRMSISEGNNRLDFDIRRDNTESTIYRDFGAGNISNTDWRLRFKFVITNLVGGNESEKSWTFGFSNLTTESISTNCNAIGFGQTASGDLSNEADILMFACDNDNPKEGANRQEIGTNLLADDTTYYYELRRIGTTTLRVTLYSDSDYSVPVITADRTIVAGDGEDMRYFRTVNTTYSSTLAGQITGYIQDMQFWNGESP